MCFDLDGHGKREYLHQSSAPQARLTDEGVIYAVRIRERDKCVCECGKELIHTISDRARLSHSRAWSVILF